MWPAPNDVGASGMALDVSGEDRCASAVSVLTTVATSTVCAAEPIEQHPAPGLERIETCDGSFTQDPSGAQQCVLPAANAQANAPAVAPKRVTSSKRSMPARRIIGLVY